MKKNERFVITINRELGSGGHTVGRVLAEKLGVPYYDKMLSKALEEKFDLSHRQIEELKGKNRSWWEEIKRGDLRGCPEGRKRNLAKHCQRGVVCHRRSFGLLCYER